MKKIDIQDLEKEFICRYQERIEGAVYLVHKTPLVIGSNSKDINMQYVKDMGLNVWNSRNFGGTIVSFENDIDIGIVKKGCPNLGKSILDFFKNKLDSKLFNVDITGNDILIDEKYKVISYASTNIGDNFYYTVVHISFNPNLEIINKVCSKRTKKIPSGLQDFGFNINELELMLCELGNLFEI